MSILSIIQDAALELGLRYPEAVVGSSDRHARQLLAHAHEEVEALLDNHPWVQLERTALITLVDGQENYALPADFDQQVFDTHWDRENHWKLRGPAAASDWAALKSGLVTVTPRRVFRVKGASDRKLFIYPTPAAGDAGQVLAFDYIGRQAVRPITWSAGATFAAGAYSFYDGNIYQTPSGGTTGASAPVHTSGTVNDGTVDWAYHGTEYVRFLKDTDTTVLPERLIKLGIKWRFKSARGFPFDEEMRQYKEARAAARSKLSGAGSVSLSRRVREPFPGWNNMRDTRFGE